MTAYVIRTNAGYASRASLMGALVGTASLARAYTWDNPLDARHALRELRANGYPEATIVPYAEAEQER